MDAQRLIRERQQAWARLERLLEQAEASPDWELGKDRLHELLRLYRQATSDLSEARSKTGNPELLGRLNDLVGRGYRFVYRRRHGERVLRALGRFFRYEVPRTFRLEAVAVLTASGAFLLGVLFGFAAVMLNRDNGERLIPREFYSESPRERVERIEREGERIDTTEEALHFGVSLYTHNIRVSFLAFSLGATTLVGGIWILFLNGVILGAVLATYAVDGVTTFFFAWVGPHGALELPAIVFGGAAGLRAGHALLLPGDRSRASSLRSVFPTVWRMMAAAALALVLAGLIEGSFSQFSAKTVPYPLKIGVALILFGSLLTYLFGRRLPEERV